MTPNQTARNELVARLCEDATDPHVPEKVRRHCWKAANALTAQPSAGEPVAWMRDLKPDWDSYGSRRISEDALAIASEIHTALTGKWQIVPVATGGVQIELHAQGIDIEIEINPDGTVEIFAEPAPTPAASGMDEEK